MMDFVVGGAQKAATTWLYLSLRDHPELRVPKKKMEWEYVGGDWQEKEGLRALEDLFGFGSGRGAAGHVSVQYLADARCASVLHKVAPKCRLIFILREPVERSVSAYRWYWRKNQISHSLNELIKLGLSEEDSGDQVGRSIARDLIERGLYGRQIIRYLEFFDPEQILILTFDEVCRDRQAVWQKVQRFLGCSELSVLNQARGIAKQNSGTRWLMNFERQHADSRVIASIANVLHQLISKIGCRQKPESLTLENQRALQDLYRNDLKFFCKDAIRGIAGAEQVQKTVAHWLSQYEG